MAVLSSTDRDRVCRAFMREDETSVTFTKDTLRSTVDAIDNWLETNATIFNLALPLLFQNGGTTQQRAMLLALVAMRRAGILKVAEDG